MEVYPDSGRTGSFWMIAWGHHGWIWCVRVPATDVPQHVVREAFLIALVPPTASWFVMSRRQEQDTIRREALIQEQTETLEHRHEELREAYLEQEQVTVELHRKMDQLTTLHRNGLLFILDRETLVQKVLDTLTSELHFERAPIAFYEQDRRIAYNILIVGFLLPRNINVLR